MATTDRTEIRGARLTHRITGDPTTNRTVIWGHGLSSSMELEDTDPMIDWSAVPARLVRYDARGHGTSHTTDNLDDYSWEAQAKDQLGLATSLGIDDYIAAGASMGCGTALWAAVLAPGRIQRLVLVIPPTAWQTRAAQAEQWRSGARVVAARGVEPMIRAMAQTPTPGPFADDPQWLDRRAAALRSWDPTRLATVLMGATVADLPDPRTLADISAPALILAWTNDPTHPISTALELDRLLPDSHLHLATSPKDLGRWSDLVADFVTL